MNSICRLCFRSDLYNLKVQRGEVPEFTLYSVDHRNEDGITIATLIRTLLPELYLGISATPRICNQCYESLKAAFSFRCKCLLTDKLIGIYTRESILPKSDVNLWDVVNYWLNIYFKMPSDANAARIADWFGFKEKNSQLPNQTPEDIDLSDVKIFLKNVSAVALSEGEKGHALVTIDDHDQVVNTQEDPGKNLPDGSEAHDELSGVIAKGCRNEANIDFVHAEDEEELVWAEHIKILIYPDPEEGAALKEGPVPKTAPIKTQGQAVPNINNPSKAIQTEIHCPDFQSPVSTAIKAKCPLEMAPSMFSPGSPRVGRNLVTRLNKSCITPHVTTSSKSKILNTASEPCVPSLPPFFNKMTSAVKSLAEQSAKKEEYLQRLVKVKSESDGLDKTKTLKPKQMKSEAQIIGKVSSGSDHLIHDLVTESAVNEKIMDSEHLLRTESTALSPGLKWGNKKILNTKSVTENEAIRRAPPAEQAGNCIQNKPILIKQTSALDASENRPKDGPALGPEWIGKSEIFKHLTAELPTEGHTPSQENTRDQGAIRSDDCIKTNLLSKPNDTMKANKKLLVNNEVEPPKMYKRKFFKLPKSVDSTTPTTPDQGINYCQGITNADSCDQTKIINLKPVINPKENLPSKNQDVTSDISKMENSKISNTEPVTEGSTPDQEKNCFQHPSKSEICDKTTILILEPDEDLSLESQTLPMRSICRIENPRNLNRHSFTKSKTPGMRSGSTQHASSACSRIRETTWTPKFEATVKTSKNLPPQSKFVMDGMTPGQEKNPDKMPSKNGLSAERKNLNLSANKNSFSEVQVLPPEPMYTIENPENLHRGSFTLSETPDRRIENTQQIISACSPIGMPNLKPNINTATRTIENLPPENESLPPELICALENLENLNREITTRASQYPANQTNNFDLIDIKDEPLDFNFDTNYGWNNFVQAEGRESLKDVKLEDSEDTISASETEVENILMYQNIPDEDLEPDIPDYVLVTRRNPLPPMSVLEKPQPSANDAVCEPKSNDVMISTKNCSRSKPMPKAAPAMCQLVPVEVEKEENKDKNLGIHIQRDLYNISHSGEKYGDVLHTNFTDNGDYVNDHDYLVNPYMRNNLTTYHKLFGSMCVCLLCGLKHASEEHIKHMQHHHSVCLVCNVSFKNVFMLNLHVRTHVWHCEECGEIVTYSRREGHHKFHVMKRLTEQQRSIKLKRQTQKERAMKLKRLTERERALQTKLLNNTPPSMECTASHDTCRRTRRRNLKGNVSEHSTASQKSTDNADSITLKSLLSQPSKSKEESSSNTTPLPHKTMGENPASTSCRHISLKTLLDNSIIAELKKSSLNAKSINENREDKGSKNKNRKRRSTELSATSNGKKEFKSTEFVDDGQCSSWEEKVEGCPDDKRPSKTELKTRKKDATPAKNLPARSCKGKQGHKEHSEGMNEVLNVQNSSEGAQIGNGESSSSPSKKQKRKSKLSTLEKTEGPDSPKRTKASLKSKVKKHIQKAILSPRALRAKARSEAQLTELESSLTGKAGK